MDIKVNSPPQFDNLQGVYQYLFQMSETINASVQAVENRGDRAIMVAMADSSGENAETIRKNTAALRELILNTAEIVREEMNQLSVQLNKDLYAYSSRYGTLEQKTSNEIKATADGLRQELKDDTRITTLETESNSLKEYRTRTEGFIHSGFIGEGEDKTIGIAIGQNLKSAAVTTINGVEYIDAGDQTCAFYTSDKVSFLLNGVEVAYFSNEALHCGNIRIDGKAELSSRWQIRSDGHMSIRWIGAST